MTAVYRNNSLPFETPDYQQLMTCYDAERTALWCYMNPNPRPVFNLTLLAETHDLKNRIISYLNSDNVKEPIHYFVCASATQGVFNLGGDVDLFIQLINSRDRDALYNYARLCVDGVYSNAIGLGIPDLTTLALVQGSALGGGFECALSCHHMVAEENVQMGFPEILFNLFPGMGAMSFLSRRVGLTQAERLVQDGKMHGARAMSEMGIVDELAADGEGTRAINQFIRQHQRASNGRLAIRQASQRIAPVTHQELIDITELWVDAALRLTSRDLRMMSRIVAAQNRLKAEESAPTPSYQPAKANALELLQA
ncbi:MAG: crotonase/enoyl-CoA hydratase family protein [Thiohalophilus sp.]|uniref:crotonase/enoyl-CoA hydratase family protein n=1 Tax=Thiohalophilus sp. TaxID=3028392 RepID=UPI0028702E25|nr:crotonase/enoyl-CoA hydratase family protein [Thiohalophilus sp.]MDR9437478.1 crotonase/enoyl-CoA hydratase family protein [Thiohalophilus sp.]